MITLKLRWLLAVAVIFNDGLAAQDVIKKYINQAFENNLLLKEKRVSLEKGLTALKEAKSLFLPVTTFDAQYVLSEGGRTIDIPVGSLMNPVYSTLNQLTTSQKFPEIGNVSEQLNPNNFYDVRIKTVMPIINPDLRINREITKQEISIQQYEIDMYKRELVKEVKSAYFHYLTATRAIRIYRSALAVVNQNLKLNRSLLQNGKGLPAYVSRAESEVNKVEVQLQNAMNDQNNARSYFNFLLNKPLHEEIVSSPDDFVPEKLPDTVLNVSQREELKSLSMMGNINNNVLKMNRAFRTPRLNAFIDIGSQGFDFNVDSKSLFYLAGLQMKIPLFTGKANLYKIEQTQLTARSVELKKENTNKQLELAASVSRNNVDNAWNAWLSLLKQEESANKYFQLINRGYQAGINSFIEFLDARNQMTTVQLQLNIQKYRVMIAIADYERQTASYSF